MEEESGSEIQSPLTSMAKAHWNKSQGFKSGLLMLIGLYELNWKRTGLQWELLSAEHFWKPDLFIETLKCKLKSFENVAPVVCSMNTFDNLALGG